MHSVAFDLHLKGAFSVLLYDIYSLFGSVALVDEPDGGEHAGATATAFAVDEHRFAGFASKLHGFFHFSERLRLAMIVDWEAFYLESCGGFFKIIGNTQLRELVIFE